MVDIVMWTIVGISIVGTVANVYKKWWSFVLWLVSNVAWVTYNIHLGAYHQAALFMVYSGLAVAGIVKWRYADSH